MQTVIGVIYKLSLKYNQKFKFNLVWFINENYLKYFNDNNNSKLLLFKNTFFKDFVGKQYPFLFKF